MEDIKNFIVASDHWLSEKLISGDIRFFPAEAPYFVATEWDGTQYPIHAVEYDGVSTNCVHPDVIVTYPDGLQHRLAESDFRQLVGKRVNPLLHGRGVELIIEEAIEKASFPPITVGEGNEIPF